VTLAEAKGKLLMDFRPPGMKSLPTKVTTREGRLQASIGSERLVRKPAPTHLRREGFCMEASLNRERETKKKRRPLKKVKSRGVRTG